MGFLAVVLIGAVIRFRLVAAAAFASGLVGLLAAPRMLASEVVVALGAFVVLLIVFLAISTVLRIRQRRHLAG
jgi:hypothetical protein